MNLRICTKDGFRSAKWMPAPGWKPSGRNLWLKISYLSRSLGITFFSADGESKTAFWGMTLCKQKYLQTSTVNKRYYGNKTKIHKLTLIWCASLTAEKLANILEIFCSSGVNGTLSSDLNPIVEPNSQKSPAVVAEVVYQTSTFQLCVWLLD